MRKSFILARIAVRTAMALWRHRITWLAAALSVAALALYQVSLAGPAASGADCADTTMAAVTRVDDSVARAAYACLDSNMRNTSEDAFVAGMHQREMPGGQVSRIGDQKLKDGGRIVFYTVEQAGGAVGYIVYLNPAGKVIKVE
jgi:hypothetical protein